MESGAHKEEARVKQRLPSGFKSLRDILMFCIGTAGIGYEAIVQSSERLNLLILYGALLGLPYIFKSDEKKNGGEQK